MENANYYRIYEKNILLSDEVQSSNFTHNNLPNSTLFQYSITSIDANGDESVGSDILSLYTLPEIAPNKPENLIVSSNQNSMDLTWDYVSGYGDPIGGDAEYYNIYKSSISSVDDLYLVGSSNFNLYTDYSLQDNMYFCYSIGAVNSEGLEGDLSDVVCNTL